MSDSKSILPKSPRDVIIELLMDRPDGDPFKAELVADGILEAFEEHDIDVTWRPAEKAHGTLGDSVT
jgi:hypothetical protein